MNVDYLIVGQGLAGTMLSFYLKHKNKSVLIIDDGHKECASVVAAGIINPITGKRLILAEDYEYRSDQASLVYRSLENLLQTSFYHDKEIIRIYQSTDEHKAWSERQHTLESQRYIKSYNPSGLFHPWIKDPYGSLTIKGHLCDISLLLSAYRKHLLGKGQLLNQVFQADNLRVNADGVQYGDIKASIIIFCEGYQASLNPFFSYLPFKHAKGEILTLKAEGVPLPDKIFYFGKWAFPIGPGLVKTGTTYHWEHMDGFISPEARQEILKTVQPHLNFPFTVVDQQAGVRPVMIDINPIIGIHPRHPRVAIFNGLGSKGALNAPTFAGLLAAHLVDNLPIKPKVNITRFNI